MVNYFGGKDESAKKQDDIKQVLEILTTTIEAMNIRLTNVSGEQIGAELRSSIQNVSAYVDSLNKTIDVLNKSVIRLQAQAEDSRKQLEEIKKQIAVIPDTVRAQQASEFYKRLDGLNVKIEQLINVQLMETKILKEQNTQLQNLSGIRKP